MKNIITTLLFLAGLCISPALSAQDKTEEKPLQYAEVAPEFPGGVDSLIRFISLNIQYPPDAMEKGVEGKLLISFVVDTAGHVVNPELVKSDCYTWDKDKKVPADNAISQAMKNEALRVVRIMPDWKPASQGGKKVSVSYRLPVSFTLN